MSDPEHAVDHLAPLEEAAAETLAGIGRRAALLRVGALAAIVIALFLLILLSGGISTDRVRDWVDSFGGAAPVAFIATSALLTVCFFPGPLLAASAGILFGTAAGFPLAMTSATLGAALAFLLARRIAHDAVEELQGPRLTRLRAWVGDRGLAAVLTARLLPGIPYNSVNYAAGLSPIALPVFLLGTVLGAAPRTYAYVAVGGSWGDWRSRQMLAAIGLLVVLAVAGLVVGRRQRTNS